MSGKPGEASKAASGPAAETFQIPPEWRERCEMLRLNAHNKGDYVPLHMDLIRTLVEATEISFIIYFSSGWDLVEFIRPKDFTPELIKEIIGIHKKWPVQTRILLKREDFPRYEKMCAAFRKKRFEQAAAGASVAFMPVFTCYAELSNASQIITRSAWHPDLYATVAAAASFPVGRLPSTKDILAFCANIVAKDPAIYDHAAVTAMVALAIAWNALRLSKRETKFCGQAALMHDVERHCAYLFKPAVPSVISEASIKDLKSQRAANGTGFHDCVLDVMRQYREKFGGGGFPEGLSGGDETSGTMGITRHARIVAIACAFSEYLLKRQDKQPLPLQTMMDMLELRAGSEFDPTIMESFIEDAVSGTVYKSDAREGSHDGD